MGIKVALKKVPQYLKRDGLQVLTNNGKQYVKTAEGKVKSLNTYALENYERDLTAAPDAYIKRLQYNSQQNADIIKNKYPNFQYEEAPLLDPTVNLKATKGPIFKKGKVSNRATDEMGSPSTSRKPYCF